MTDRSSAWRSSPTVASSPADATGRSACGTSIPAPSRTVETGSPITDVAVSADGDLVASSGSDGIVRFWTTDDLSDPVVQTAAVAAGANAVVFSGTSEVVAAYGDGRVRFWNRDGSEIARRAPGRLGRRRRVQRRSQPRSRACSPPRAQPTASRCGTSRPVNVAASSTGSRRRRSTLRSRARAMRS